MTTEEKLREQLQITQEYLKSIKDMDANLQKLINEEGKSYEHAYFSLSKFISETYIANQKAVEDVWKSTNEVEKEKRKQIDAWVNFIKNEL